MDWQFPTDSVCPTDDDEDKTEEAVIAGLVPRLYPPVLLVLHLAIQW